MIFCLWLLAGCVEGGSGYFYPKPKYVLDIRPSIELFSKTITYEETPVYRNYAQAYTTRTPIRQNYYVHPPTKSYTTKIYNRGHYNQGPLIQQPSIKSSQTTANSIQVYDSKGTVKDNQLIMDMGDYKISVPLSSDGLIADGEYLVKIPIYQTVPSK